MITADQILAHLVGDYLLQSDWMAQRKRTSSSAAFVHAAVYAACFLPILGWNPSPRGTIAFEALSMRDPAWQTWAPTPTDEELHALFWGLAPLPTGPIVQIVASPLPRSHSWLRARFLEPPAPKRDPTLGFQAVSPDEEARAILAQMKNDRGDPASPGAGHGPDS